jgi:hypothetical protein
MEDEEEKIYYDVLDVAEVVFGIVLEELDD